MGIASWFRGLFRAADTASGVTVVNSRSAPPRKGVAEILAAYGTHPWLHAPVDRLASEVAAALHFRLFDSFEGTPNRQEIFGDPILDLLRTPHPSIEPFTFWRLVQAYRETAGESFLVIDGNRMGRPAQMTPLPPTWVKGTPTSDRPTFQVSVGNAVGLEVRAEAMIWLKDPSLVNPFGRGAGTALTVADELDTDEYAAKLLRSWFASGAVPDFLIAVKGADRKELEKAEEKFRARYSGPRRSAQAHWAGGEMTVERLDTTFKDQQLVDLRKDIRDRIAQTWGIPPEIFGIIENSNRTTIEAAYYILGKGLLYPRIRSLVGQLQLQLVPKFGRRDRHLGFRSPIPDDIDRQLRAIAVCPSAFTAGELRELAGLLPGPDASKPLTSGTSVAGPTNVPPGKSAELERALWSALEALTDPKQRP